MVISLFVSAQVCFNCILFQIGTLTLQSKNLYSGDGRGTEENMEFESPTVFAQGRDP